MVIGIHVNSTKDVGFIHIKTLIKAITSRGGVVKLAALEGTAEFAGQLEFPPGASEIIFEADDVFPECDMVISLGGDGTLIKTAKRTFNRGIPVFGVNLGNLGFLAEVEVADIDEMIGRIFEGDYYIEERLMLCARVFDHPGSCREYTVLNDISLTRGNLTHSIEIKTRVDGAPLEVYPGDGVIVATPTGSTAYSLSAGGPIIDPVANAILIVPVCPHTVFMRPVIISPNRSITISLEREIDSANLSFDGVDNEMVGAGQTLEITRSAYVTRIVRFGSGSFYSMLKNKLFLRE
ncbi:MAG: NAD(+)/NADH kinase [Oscillospiraceae bacterium]|nr:NAD(+)/NADH kinase [Oscillospiraceae bacterium]